MMNLIVAWSGGLDSTYTLVRLLEEGHFVQAHHVVIKSSDGRYIKEIEAVKKIRNILTQRFPKTFEYTESEVDFRDFANKLKDISIVCFAMSCAIRDFKKHRHQGKILDGWTTGSHYHEPHTEEIKQGFKLIQFYCGRDYHIDFGVNGRVAKDEQKDFLKKYGCDDLVWSCRYPINDGECGICATCKGLN